MGRFETEVVLKIHRTLCSALLYYKLIGTDDYRESLKQYSRFLLQSFIEEQLAHFPNLFRYIDSFIINSVHIFYYVIVNDSIPISDISPVLQTANFESQDEAVVRFFFNTKESLITSTMAELYHDFIPCNIKTKEELMATSMENPLQWNAV